MENLDPGVSLILLLLETEAPSVEVNDEVSGARITGSFFFKSLAMQYVNDSSQQNESCPMLLLHYILLQQLELR